jgi:hypothetical protein
VLSHFGLRPTTLIAGCCFALGILTTLLLREPKAEALDALGADVTDAFLGGDRVPSASKASA